jgi:epoxyqueuosine reductase
MLGAAWNSLLLRRLTHRWGAALFGVADIVPVRELFAIAPQVTARFDRAVVVGVPLSAAVLDEITDQPTKLYFHHYRTLNMFLDQLTLRMVRWIEERRHAALAVPASQITDWQNQTAHLSHKKLGAMAGIGWMGRNNLLVHPRFGARFRMATVLTDMPLRPGRPRGDDCGACRACVAACPAGAIHTSAADFDHRACFETLKGFQQKNIVGQYICGVCVKACRGKKAMNNEK